MEFIDGVTLEQRLQERGALPVEHARELFLAVAEGLAAAHARKIVHRDIKPANILLRPESTPVLVDFGLATVADDNGLTQTGRSAGYTKKFAAPEQLRDRPADARSDIYSLAASLYYALVYDKPEHHEPDRFDAEYVPEILRELLTAALHNKPERRPQTIEAFREALLGGLDGREVRGGAPKKTNPMAPYRARSGDALAIQVAAESFTGPFITSARKIVTN